MHVSPRNLKDIFGMHVSSWNLKSSSKNSKTKKQRHVLMEMSIFIDISGEHFIVEAAQEPFHTLSVEIRTNPPYFQFHWKSEKIFGMHVSPWNLRGSSETASQSKTAILLTKCWIFTHEMSNLLFNTEIEKWGRSLFYFLDHFLTFQSHFQAKTVKSDVKFWKPII